MVLMTKNGKTEFVPDIFVASYLGDGYTVVGNDTAEAVTSPVVEEPEDNGADEEIGQTTETTLPGETEPVRIPDKFACPVCGKEYTRKAYLDKHIADKHS